MDMLKHPGMVDMPELLEKLDALRGEGKKIVFTNGCYDILHPGHVDLLERCKAQGDVQRSSRSTCPGCRICWNAARRRAMCWCSG